MRLADVLPFSILELDVDLYFADGVQVIFLFNPINKICFECTATAGGPTFTTAGATVGL